MAAVTIIENGVPIVFIRITDLIFWALVQNDNFDPPESEAYKSTDGGKTWTLTGDQGWTSVGWLSVPAPAVFDGDHTVTFFFSQGNFTRLNFLIQYDLNSGTWSAPFAELDTGDSGITYIPQAIARKSNGHFVVLYTLDETNEPQQVLPVYSQEWDGAAWSTAVHVSADAEASGAFDPNLYSFVYSTAALDSSDNWHIVLMAQETHAPFTAPPLFYYQQLSAAGAVVNFFEFPGQVAPNPDLVSLEVQPAPNLLISGNTLYWMVNRNNYSGQGASTFPAVYVGSPIDNPTWRETGNIDPGQAFGPIFAPSIYQNGNTIFAAYSQQTDGQGNSLRLLATSDGFGNVSGTTAQTGLDNIQNLSPLLQFGARVFMVAGSPPSEGGTPPTVFLTADLPAPIIKITFRGVKRVRCKPQEQLQAMCTLD